MSRTLNIAHLLLQRCGNISCRLCHLPQTPRWQAPGPTVCRCGTLVRGPAYTAQTLELSPAHNHMAHTQNGDAHQQLQFYVRIFRTQHSYTQVSSLKLDIPQNPHTVLFQHCIENHV